MLDRRDWLKGSTALIAALGAAGRSGGQDGAARLDGRQAAAAEMALQMMEQNADLMDEDDLDDEDLPAELRELSAHTRRMQETLKQKAKDAKDKQPPDAEASAVADLMSQMMREAEDMEDEDDDPPKKKKKR